MLQNTADSKTLIEFIVSQVEEFVRVENENLKVGWLDICFNKNIWEIFL